MTYRWFYWVYRNKVINCRCIAQNDSDKTCRVEFKNHSILTVKAEDLYTSQIEAARVSALNSERK